MADVLPGKNKIKNPQFNTIALAAIFLFGLILSLLLFKGMSFYGDDASYVQYIPSILSGTFSENINIFSIRLLMDIPLAISVGIFGYTDLGAGAWALISYLVIIPMIYLIGKELGNEKGGLIAAFLFSFYPLIIHFNSSPDPMLPMALFLTASLLFFVKGTKKSDRLNYWIAGFLAFLATLANPIAYLYLLFYAFYFIAGSAYLSIKRHNPTADLNMLYLLLGVATAIAVLGYVNMAIANGNPFLELNMTNSYYSAAGGPDQIFYTNPSLTYYINGYFPYGIIPFITNNTGVATNLHGAIQRLFSINQLWANDVGFFGYIAVILGLYLLAEGRRESRFVLLLAAFLVGYMEFGSMSITHYFPIYKLMRFTVVAAVPILLVMGFALSEFIWGKRHISDLTKNQRIGIATGIIIFLLATSLPINYFYYAYNHNTMAFIKQTAHSLSAANLDGASVFATAESPGYLAYYLGFPQNTPIFLYDNGAYGGIFLPTCASIPHNSYVIIPSPEGITAINSYNLWTINETWAYDPSECNLTLYANTSNIPGITNNSLYNSAYAGNIYYNK